MAFVERKSTGCWTGVMYNSTCTRHADMYCLLVQCYDNIILTASFLASSTVCISSVISVGSGRGGDWRGYLFALGTHGLQSFCVYCSCS